jgi:hypothetical protein
MGTWGTALFSDDTAADVRDDFRDCIGDGLSVDDATARLKTEFLAGVDDDDEDAHVFWLALAVSQWNLGRIHEPTRRKALEIIASGRDLERWDAPRDREKRREVLAKVAERLNSPPPSPKNVPKRHCSANQWNVGEVIELQLKSGRSALLRVVGHHEDKGGRFAVVEVLDWEGIEIPTRDEIDSLGFRRARRPHEHISQFMFCEPRSKKDQLRVRRLAITSRPQQTCGGYTVLIWKLIDAQMEKFFGMV